MNNTSLTPELLRVCDANLNRLKEGIRVVEDILRYKDNNKTLAKKLKSLRHQAITENTKELLQHRDSINDVLRPSTSSEQTRTSLEAIIIANLKRAQESSRVLEELYKLEDINTSEKFKTIRYELYNLEKEIILTQE
ncbi:MAG: thiamine-phosphate pyrophosphorylase [Campylobacterales bacterium]|nr:thiamine-phosphate pyrophosphorylase [Campylobacterales bacterium]